MSVVRLCCVVLSYDIAIVLCYMAVVLCCDMAIVLCYMAVVLFCAVL